ncbi:hypothetical protein [Planktotalea sp.]|uniref:hypothetical protein n=1 Tax=Planktotalea sp. TaxID=2029877 RepID=UPI003D6BDA06
MASVSASPLPKGATLSRYAEIPGAYVDCFKAGVEGDVSLQTFISTFFDTWVFRLERKLLALFARVASRSHDVQRLATGESDSLALWSVESRDADQILLAVGGGPIRTWLMRISREGETHLFFGSAVLPTGKAADGAPQMGGTYRLFLRFHTLYSRLLLKAVVREFV